MSHVSKWQDLYESVISAIETLHFTSSTDTSSMAALGKEHVFRLSPRGEISLRPSTAECFAKYRDSVNDGSSHDLIFFQILFKSCLESESFFHWQIQLTTRLGAGNQTFIESFLHA